MDMSENAAACNRYVIWKGASLDECSRRDRDWLAELLKSRELGSIQELNGIQPQFWPNSRAGSARF